MEKRESKSKLRAELVNWHFNWCEEALVRLFNTLIVALINTFNAVRPLWHRPPSESRSTRISNKRATAPTSTSLLWVVRNDRYKFSVSMSWQASDCLTRRVINSIYVKERMHECSMSKNECRDILCQGTNAGMFNVTYRMLALQNKVVGSNVLGQGFS